MINKTEIASHLNTFQFWPNFDVKYESLRNEERLMDREKKALNVKS